MTPLDSLLGRVSAEQDAILKRSTLAQRLAVRLGGEVKATPRNRRAWALAFAAAAVAVALGVFAVGRDVPLEVRVGRGNETALVGAWLGAPDSKPLPLEFSDGSRFELAPSSRARLVELKPEGARVELAAGRLKVHVVHQRGSDYRLVAGPFVVRVTGTRFETSYVPERDAFELYLEEGQVEIEGCGFGSGRKLAAGQSVKASCAKPAIDVRYGPPRPDAKPEAPAPKPASSVALSSAPPSSERKPEAEPRVTGERRALVSAPPEAASPSWRALAQAGDYRAAFALVEEGGFDVECARADADGLGLLADMARHAGAPRRAEQALLTLRRRFPGTSDASLAAFTLGRLEFDERRAYARAATWFDTYLRERPAGSMAREALGRLMEARYRSGNAAGAREIAARYVREYPSGPHAELASRIVASP
jgi:TolA-binding protein